MIQLQPYFLTSLTPQMTIRSLCVNCSVICLVWVEIGLRERRVVHGLRLLTVLVLPHIMAFHYLIVKPL